jgi:lipopolysaccharide export system protein LptA
MIAKGINVEKSTSRSRVNKGGIMIKSFKAGIAVLAMLTLSPLASAQFSADSNAPVSGSSDSVDYRPDVTIFSGQVDVRQGEVRILSDQMRVHTPNSAASGANAIGGANKIEAIGNFFYLTPEQEVRGDKGVYLKSTETFTVTGNVVLLQGDGNVVTGDKLVYDLTNGTAKVLGSCQGRRCGSKGRVNILLKNNGNTNTL